MVGLDDDVCLILVNAIPIQDDHGHFGHFALPLSSRSACCGTPSPVLPPQSGVDRSSTRWKDLEAGFYKTPLTNRG